MKGRHLVADISAHGFGHLAQTTAVLDALHRLLPSLAVTIRTGHDEEILRKFLTIPFETAPPPPDIGMIMHGPSSIDVPASYGAYRDLHGVFEDVVEQERQALADLAPDLLYANIPYTSLAAAKSLNLPSVALCSLNWYDIFSGYCLDEPAGQDIAAEIRAAYEACLFLRPTPSMEMPWHPDTRAIGPIARPVSAMARREDLSELAGGKKLVLVSLGGIRSDFDPGQLPQLPEVRWIIPAGSPFTRRNDISPVDATGHHFAALVPVADAIVTKSGYGIFVEAAAAGTRVLYAARPDWPEASALEPWLDHHGTAAPVSREALYEGAFADDLLRLLNREKSPPIATTGAAEAANIMKGLLE